MNGAAAKGSEPCTEDHPGIEQVGILHYSLPQAGEGFVQQLPDQPFRQFRGDIRRSVPGCGTFL